MNQHSIGIMQGRLTPRKGREIQFFPFDNWENEFYLAKNLGLDEIEWIFDWENYEENPLWTSNMRKRIVEVVKQTGVTIHSVCFDYFMRRPFYKEKPEKEKKVYDENVQILTTIIEAAHQIKAHLIEIPLVDNSSVKTELEQKKMIEFIQHMSIIAQTYHIMLGLETDFPPAVFKNFLDKIDRKNVVANYDSGNSSGLGYRHREELLSLNQYVYNVHIKDRIYGGTSVPLGTGSADMKEVFASLKQIEYKGSIILQAARGEDGREEENIREQKQFVLQYLS
ncbi:MAG: sugar phosphate isomerase/epimerase [Lachnospiraceae bacterium]